MRRVAKGFTLIEMLIGIVIMGMAISMVSVSIGQSVRNQERMQHLLDLYQVALTTKTQVIEQVRESNLTGSYQTGDVTVKWQARLREQKDEASVFIVDSASFSAPTFTISYYDIVITVESQFARRIYQFEQMIEQHKSQSRFGF